MPSKKALFFKISYIHAIAVEDVPRVGSCYNIRRVGTPGAFAGGQYRVTAVDTYGWEGKTHDWADMERVGDFAPDLPIHEAALMSC